MKKILTGIIVIVIAVCLVIGLALISYHSGKAATIQDAVKKAQAMNTAQKKTDYLIKQAQLFLDSKDFQGAIDLARYVMRNLDSDSRQAGKLVMKAQDAMAVQKEMTEKKANK